VSHDVFISYSSADKPTADAVCATLESRGIRCWIAPRDVLPGMDWASAIIDAIHESRVMVLVYSAKANDSQQIKREVERAVNRGIAVIPFRIEDVPMSKTLEYFISTPHWLDALTPPLQQHLERLAETTRLILEQDGVAVNPPSARAADPAPHPQPVASSGEIVRGIGRWVTGGTEAPTLAQVFVPRTDLVANVALIAATVVAITIFAQVRIGPIWLLPLAVLLAGAALGSRSGAIAALAYVGLGIVGLPVFGGGVGAWTDVDYRGPFAQHAMGYLLGLVAAAFAVGWLAERRSWDRRIPTAALLGLVGVGILYIPGRIWAEVVALFMRESSRASVLPSIPMLVITVGVMALALPGAWSWVADQQHARLKLPVEAMVLDTEPKSLEPEPKG
jgi:biotin transporter BioY